MNSKKAKQLRKLARRMAHGKPPGETNIIYNRLKKTYKVTKGEI